MAKYKNYSDAAVTILLSGTTSTLIYLLGTKSVTVKTRFPSSGEVQSGDMDQG